MQLYEPEIRQLVESLWSSVLGLEVGPTSEPLEPAAIDGCLASAVEIDGAWRGVVLLQCPEDLARRATISMFGDDSGGVTPDKIRDTLGELVNITGGNIKALLPEPCQLSLPKDGASLQDALLSDPHIVLSQVGFLCDGRPFLISLLSDQGSS